MEGKPKSEALTRGDKESLLKRHREIVEYWKDRRNEYPHAKNLDENFKLVKQARETHYTGPECSLVFLSNYGSIRLNLWVTERESKKLVFNGEVYTMGEEGNIKGKGKDGINALQNILQSIADITGYSVDYIATPNLRSAPILDMEKGFRTYDEGEHKRVLKLAGDDGVYRLDVFTKATTPYDSRIKTFTPIPNTTHSDREKYEVGVLTQLALIGTTAHTP
jgi:hypothetical protein